MKSKSEELYEIEKTLDYEKVVAQALSGNQNAYSLLYHSTYQQKYFIALKYLKNEADVHDVLQDAYTQAFAKLGTLREPAKFPAWLGMIVANTAKNALQKRKTVLFSEMELCNDEGETVELQIEDTNVENQPETSYLQQETQDMVREMLDSLSDEQRFCILMFHIEGYSISEIAQAMGCSENTVKSRLNYGRKNIKAQAETLQKKGYKLYGMSPVALFIYLFHLEEMQYITSALIPIPALTSSVITGANALETATAQAAKQTFFHTVAGKIITTIAGIGLLGGIGIGAFLIGRENRIDETPPLQQMTDEASVSTEAPTPNPTETPVPMAYKWQSAYEEQLKKKMRVQGYDLDTGRAKSFSEYSYTMHDINGDNIPELILAGVANNGARPDTMYRIYSYAEERGIYKVGEIVGGTTSFLAYQEGKQGMIAVDSYVSYGTGDAERQTIYTRYYMENEKLREQQKTKTIKSDVEDDIPALKGQKSLPDMTANTDLTLLNLFYQTYLAQG